MASSEGNTQKYLSVMSNQMFPKSSRSKKDGTNLRKSLASKNNIDKIQNFIIKHYILGDLESEISKTG